MATYSRHEILDLLYAICDERIVKPSAMKRGRPPEPSWQALHDMRGSAVFVKLLGFTSKDVILVGGAELVVAHLDNVSRDAAGGWSVEGGWSIDGLAEAVRDLRDINSAGYSSTQIKSELESALERRVPPSSVWDDDWVVAAAGFVRRLAADKGDQELVSAAAAVVGELQRRRSEAEFQAQQEEDAERREREEDEERRFWTEADAVPVSQLAAHLAPPLRSADVNKLLVAVGVQRKDPEKGWVLTSAGVPYSKSPRAAEGVVVEWRTWSKDLLSLLQAECDRVGS